MAYHVILWLILLIFLFSGCSKNEISIPEDSTLMGHVNELTVSGSQNSRQTDITIRYNFQVGVPPVTKNLKTDNQGDFTIMIPREQNMVEIIIEKEHFLGIDTTIQVTGTTNFNTQIVQVVSFLPLERNREWQYDVQYIVGDTEGGGTTTYNGTESWQITDLDTSTNGFELQITFNGTGIYDDGVSRDTTSYVNEINTIMFSLHDRRLEMTSCASCFQRTTIFDRLNTLLNEINTFSGDDMRVLVEHPITVTDNLEINETDSNGNTILYVLNGEEGLISLEVHYNAADVFEIYNYQLITP